MLLITSFLRLFETDFFSKVHHLATYMFCMALFFLTLLLEVQEEA
jgi:hypothetical protein